MSSLQAFREQLHISVSALKSYLRCPRSFEFRYVRGETPSFVPIPLVFGSAFHAALAVFYSRMKETGIPPPLEMIEAEFRDAWARGSSGPIPLQSTDEEGDEDVVDKGIAMVGAFYSVAGDAPAGVDSVERPFSVELHDPDSGELIEERLVGAFDVVLGGPPFMVLEHKTSARRYSKDQLSHDLQPTAYQLAAREIGLGDVGLVFQIVTKAKLPLVQVEEVFRSSDDETDFLKTAVGVLKAVDAGSFYPLRGPMCWSCPFRVPCEARRRD